MGWVEKRVDALKKGRKLNWIERRMLEHANSVHLFVLVVVAMFLITGLWEHDWTYTVIGIVMALLGHVYCWLKR
jgi:hypothetical protein